MCESSEEELEIDDFKNLEDKIKKFTENHLPKSNENEDDQHNSFIRAILYAIRYQKEIKPAICNKDDFKYLINEELMEELHEKKYELILDLQKFNNDCYEINFLLSDFNYFLTVYELKK